MIPLSVVIDEMTYRDGVEIELADVYTAMREGRQPKTSQILWEDAENIFETAAKAGEDILYLAFSSAMSGTYGFAVQILKELRGKYPDVRMEAVDSLGGSMGSGLIALQLGLMQERGAAFDEMLENCTDMAKRVRYAFTINDFQCALRGGRLIARSAGTLGDLLDIKPVMDVKNGMLHLSKLVRGTKHSLTAIADMVAAAAAGFPDQIIGITHADDPEKAEHMAQLIKERLPQCDTLSMPIGAVLGCHLGIGGVGVYCMEGRPKAYYRP